MKIANEGNPISVSLAKVASAALTLALLGLAAALPARANGNDGPSSSKEKKTVISLDGTQQYNPCVDETVTITRGKDTIRTRNEQRPQGGVRIETKDQSEGEGFGDVSYLRYHYDELFETRTESSETTFSLRLEHRKHLIREKNSPPNDDYFERSELRMTVTNGVENVKKNDLRIECK